MQKFLKITAFLIPGTYQNNGKFKTLLTIHDDMKGIKLYYG